MNCSRCNTENKAEARFCLNCGAKLEKQAPALMRCGKCGADLPENARFCPGCGTAVGAPTSPPLTPAGEGADKAQERLQRLVPKEFAERLLATRGKVERERRLVTILFSDVKGSTQMAEKLDPEEVLDIMNGAFDALIEPVYRHEGTLARLMGDAILAFFGAPISHEDDPERAVRAALEILARVKVYAARLEQDWGIKDFSVRIGIHTGLVVVGEVGSDLRVEYTAMGDAINLAARLEQNAPVGGILVSQETYQHLRGRFDVQTLPPLSVKGKAEPVTVYRVLRPQRRGFHSGGRGVVGIETPLVGRQHEMSILQQATQAFLGAKLENLTGRLGQMGRGSVHFLTVYGEAGVGKSRLLFEYESWLHAQPQRVEMLRGRALPATLQSPYGLVRDMFQERFEILENDSAAEVRRKFEAGMGDFLPQERMYVLGHVLGFGFGDTQAVKDVAGSKLMASEAMDDLSLWLRVRALQTPLLILLDDLHWADDSSLDFLEKLMSEITGERLLVIGMARHRFGERRPEWGGTQAYVRLDLAPLSEKDSRELVEVIFRKMVDPPAELHRLVIERAEGNPFYLEELVMMLIGDGVIVCDEAGWRVEAERLKALRVPTTLVGVLQARLDSLPEAEKQVLQRAAVVGRRFWDGIVESLSDEDRLVEDDLQPLIDRLGERQLVFQEPRSTFAGAQEYLFKHAILHDVTYETVLLKLRRLYHRQAAEWLEANCIERVEEYAALIAGHYEQAHENQKATAWLRKAGDAALEVSASTAALEAYQRALALTPEDDPGRTSLLERLGVSCMLLGKFDEGSGYLQQSVDLARQREDWATLARALSQLCFIRVSRDGLEAGRAMAEEGMEAARRSGDQKVISNLIMRIVEYIDDERETTRLMNEALEFFRKTGDRRGAATCLMNMGIMHADANRYPEAAPFYREAADIYRQIGNRWGLANCLANLGGVHVKARDYTAAIKLCEEALRIERDIGDRESACFALLDLGDAYLHLGEEERAVDYLRKSLIDARDVGVTVVMLEDLSRLAQIYACRGETQRAGRILGVLHEHPAWDGDWHVLTDEAMKLLEPVMSAAEIQAAMAQGKAQGLEALVRDALG